jgi:hypothetical protein
MPHPIVTTVTAIAGNATLIAASQTLTAPALAMTLTSAVVTLDTPRRVIVTSAGNDSGITFTITGTSRTQQGSIAQSETITGGNAAAASTTQDFATVTGTTASGSTASTVTVGTSGTASGPWVPWDMFIKNFQVAIQANVLSGSPTYQVDVTQDDVFGTWLPSGVPFPRAFPWPGLVGATASVLSSIDKPVRASRLTLTAVGSVQLTQQQAGSV